MNDLANRRFTEQVRREHPREPSCDSRPIRSRDAHPVCAFPCAQLNKEKDQRRAWAAHSAQQQVFDTSSEEFDQLKSFCSTLDRACMEPSRTGVTDVPEQPSRRKQLKQLRDEMRATLANVDKKLEQDEAVAVDPKLVAAMEEAKERAKRPPHLRGAQLLKETLGS